jgi:protein-disulfide isomerase
LRPPRDLRAGDLEADDRQTHLDSADRSFPDGFETGLVPDDFSHSIRAEWSIHMAPTDPVVTPSGHTPEGGVLVGNANARHKMILYEDPQCPFCRQFEELDGPVLSAAVGAGSLAVEYRMRCFLGKESVRADNALALAAEAGRFDPLRQALFAAQPPEGSGGFTIEDLLRIGADAGLNGSDYVAGVQEARYQTWVLRREDLYQRKDPQGTPAAWLDGDPLDSNVLFDARLLAGRIRT